MKSKAWTSVTGRLKAGVALLSNRTALLGLLLFVPLILGSFSGFYFSYADSRGAILDNQKEKAKAKAAASRVGQYIQDIQRQMAATVTRGSGVDVLEKRMDEIQLLSRNPAITETLLLDLSGKERLRVSAFAPDAINSMVDHSSETFYQQVRPGSTYCSPVYYLQGREPHITVAMVVGPPDAGITVVKINLEFLLDGIRDFTHGVSGYAYVVDASGRLIAHPDLELVLRQRNLSDLPQVAAALKRLPEAEASRISPVGLDGSEVFSAHGFIPQLGWLVFVEQPRHEVLAPLHSAAVRNGLLLFLGAACAVVASFFLVRARQLAEAAARQKADFLAMISHEMRTPLGGVTGMLGLVLRDRRVQADIRQQIQIARSNAQSLLVIINDLLDLSKIEAGKLTTETVDFDLRALIQEALSAIEIRAHDKDLLLKTDVSAELPQFCVGDPTRIRQILLNLLGNAVKFTARGGVSLIVRLAPATDATAMFEFSVVDTGPGISPEALPRLFQKFEQADASTTRSYGGTGLGLAICKELAELMGGCISVSSAVGKGSTFCLRVPLGLGQEPELGEGQTEGQQHSHRLRILCAEDGPTNQIIISSILQELGHEIEIVEHGLAAVRRLAEREFDLVLMDGRMPCMDGEAAARCIRSGGTEDLRVLSPDITIVALTANAGKEDRERYLAAGMDGFLRKPIDERELFEEIGRVISVLQRTGRELPAMDSDKSLQGSCAAAPDPVEASAPCALSQTPLSDGALDDIFGVQESSARISKAQPLIKKRVPASSGERSSNDLMVRVAAAFVQDAPRRFRSAQDALDRGDAATAAMEFHSLRGAAAYANLGGLQDALAELEALADDENLGAVAQRIQQAESLLDAGVAFMDKIAGPRLGPPG